MQKKVFILVIGVFLVLTGFYAAFSQEPAATEQNAPVAPSVTQAPPAAVTTPETQWVWGEIVSVDAAKNELVIKYLDYETDQEKEMAIGVDDKTAYENAKSLADVKSKDTLSIDYIVTADGKNVARNISVEKAESAAPAAAPVQEQGTVAQPPAPVETTPAAQQ